MVSSEGCLWKLYEGLFMRHTQMRYITWLGPVLQQL